MYWLHKSMILLYVRQNSKTIVKPLPLYTFMQQFLNFELLNFSKSFSSFFIHGLNCTVALRKQTFLHVYWSSGNPSLILTKFTVNLLIHSTITTRTTVVVVIMNDILGCLMIIMFNVLHCTNIFIIEFHEWNSSCGKIIYSKCTCR